VSATPSTWIGSWRDRRVLVIGEAMLDSYLEGTSTRLCQEAPVPVVAVAGRTDVPGGAANVAVNATSLGARADLVSVIGSDAEGDVVREALKAHGISDIGVLTDPGRRTLAKQRVVADAQLLVRFDQGTTEALSDDIEAALLERLRALWQSCDAVIVSDYAYGVLTPRVVAEIARLQQRDPRLLVVDAKDLGAYRGVGVTAVKPNYAQVVALLGIEALRARTRPEGIIAVASELLDVTGAQLAAVTLDAEGGVVVERDRPPYRMFVRPSSNARAAGAGDTFVCAFTLALAAGALTPAAAELASRAAAIVVGKKRTAACSALELRESFGAGEKYLDAARLVPRVEYLRRQGLRIAFTNGCFDILHRGHITYLSRAKMLGDVLIVGVNSDSGVARLKGPSRPINRLEDRVEVLAALSSIDHIVAFDEDTPARLLEALRPDVFVKGGDYTIDRLPEAEVVEAYGGEVSILGFVEDRSTTGIIERIRGSS
jgi:D-beta-D-heptose 7-phosphate kinase/D-beta-D-heptose 1-phosphate adenosyltransferase